MPFQSKFLDATQFKNTGRPPIWLMRQAGRYMPEYQAIRKKHGFLEMIHTPELACEITLQPIDIFGFDAAILFSDILVTSAALGRPVQFVEGIGPVIKNPIRSASDVAQLSTQDIELSLAYVPAAIRLLRPELDKRHCPLIGFAGAPFTVASYMIEGQSSPTLSITKERMATEPEMVHALLSKLTDATIRYLQSQLDAGVHALQLFDTWTNHLSIDQTIEFSIPYITKIINALDNPSQKPILIFTKNSAELAPYLIQTGATGLSIDTTGHLPELRKAYPNLLLQGNLDPTLLAEDHTTLKTAVITLLNSMKNDPGYIFNLGHGITPNIKPNTIHFLVDLVKEFN